ncbi:MAG TPA: PPOX class F420-dependent oxidoreductase [Thermomicrobiales bacterium]|nr:PPOX class F420-dependent oxidoreductase [Thermomicrobiales bacterium]
MPVEIPADFHPLLESRAIAYVSTLGAKGEPQTSPIWFMWDGETVSFSLVDGRQKLKNLRRDPRISVAIADLEVPTWYIELRGRIDDLVEDPGRELERAIAIKYTGEDFDVDPAGTMRYDARVIVEKITFQRGI